MVNTSFGYDELSIPNLIYIWFRQSPHLIRKLMYLIPIEKRLGGFHFVQKTKYINETDKLPRTELLKHQERELANLLEYAVNNIPFYKDIKLNHSEDAFHNILRFPIIDKEVILKSPHLFINDKILKNQKYCVTTGGTSGNYMEIFLDNSTYGEEWAFMTSMWARVGYKPGDRIAAFRGVEFSDKKISDKKFWQLNPIYNALEFSPFHMSDENLPKYISTIQKWNPKYIHGYPSLIAILTKYIENNGISEFPNVKAILAGSENIYQQQREYIEKTLNTRVFSWYGQTEKVILAGECEHSHLYHIFPQYGYTEIISDDGEIIPWDNIGESGELVGTGFLNHVMPFIRYKTGDFATIAGWGCKECLRDYPLIMNVRGHRTQEMFVGKNGILISTTPIDVTDEIFKNVKQYQFYQDTIGEVIFRIIKGDNYSDNDSHNIINYFNQLMSDNVQVQLSFVDNIERTKSGKFIYVIQKLPLENQWKDLE